MRIVGSGEWGQFYPPPPQHKTIPKKSTQIRVKRWYTIDFFLKIFFLRQLISGTCSISRVVKSVCSRVSVCIMQTYNCTKINLIGYTLLLRVVSNKNYWRRNLKSENYSTETKQSIFCLVFLNMQLQINSYPCYTFIILTMLEEFRLIICLDNLQ